MKRSIFAKVFIGSVIWTVVFMAIGSFAFDKAKTDNPKMEKNLQITVLEYTKPSGNYVKDAWSFDTTADIISVVTVSGKIQVRSTQGDKIMITANGNLDTKKSPRLLNTEVKPGKIVVSEPEDNAVSDLSVVVLIPENFQKELNLVSVTGDLNLKNLTLKKIDLVTMSGEVWARKVSFLNGYVKSVSGDISISNEQSGALKVVSVSGDVKVKLRDAKTTNVQVESVSGDIERDEKYLHNSGDKIFDVSINTVSGDVEVR